ncbi:MAG: CHAT domain-containing protein, partial [Pyrinomonadaceae bacterium]
RDGGVEGFSREITASDLTQRVLTYLQAVSSKPQTDSPADWASARELFDILIGPIASRLDIKRRLCMVPDKALNLLPFAALRSPAGKYLIEDYVLQISPSSTVFIMCSEIANQKQERIAENVLSVGNPTFDRTAYQLPDLPAATREAVQIASLYNSQYPLIEKEATLAATRRAMEGADVIHLALHSVLDERFPLRSKLLFAKTKAPEPDALSTYDVYRMRFSRTRLVVLSSCQTGAERYYKGEGMIGLARPFIAARVPLVVASLWPVESDSTADLMIRFHRHRVLEKTSTAEALARAQREMLSDSDQRYHQPYYWAPFTLIGGYARF